MSGFLGSDVRFPRRSNFLERLWRAFALNLARLLDWMSGRDHLFTHSRHFEAEFPPVAQSMDKLIVSIPRGQRATDCASFDALRPTRNWEITKDYYEISFSWERLAASAPGWLPQAIRWTARRRSVTQSRKKNLMAAICGFVRKRQCCRQIDRRRPGAQWIARPFRAQA
jgi:hypothetical protein